MPDSLDWALKIDGFWIYVVTESPKFPIARNYCNGATVRGSLDRPSKNGGFWIYVDSSSHSKRGSSVVSISFHFSLESKTLSYSLRNISGVTTFSTSALI